MQPMLLDLKRTAKENDYYRRVLFTANHSQLVLMSLPPGTEIGLETHPVDQFFYIVEGEGTAILEGRKYPLEKGDGLCVPADLEHNIVSAGDEPLKLFTIYSPAQHPAGREQKEKPEPVAAVLF